MDLRLPEQLLQVLLLISDGGGESRPLLRDVGGEQPHRPQMASLPGPPPPPPQHKLILFHKPTHGDNKNSSAGRAHLASSPHDCSAFTQEENHPGRYFEDKAPVTN